MSRSSASPHATHSQHQPLYLNPTNTSTTDTRTLGAVKTTATHDPLEQLPKRLHMQWNTSHEVFFCFDLVCRRRRRLSTSRRVTPKGRLKQVNALQRESYTSTRAGMCGDALPPRPRRLWFRLLRFTLRLLAPFDASHPSVQTTAVRCKRQS